MAKSAAPTKAAANGRVTRDDIERKLRELAGDVDEKVESAKPVVVSGAVAGIVLVALVAYLLGRRRGRAKSAVVEIRRL